MGNVTASYLSKVPFFYPLCIWVPHWDVPIVISLRVIGYDWHFLYNKLSHFDRTPVCMGVGSWIWKLQNNDSCKNKTVGHKVKQRVKLNCIAHKTPRCSL